MDMLALVKTVCCLYHRTLPAESADSVHRKPDSAQETFWANSEASTNAKHALVAAVSADGQVAHAVLSAHHTRPWLGAGIEAQTAQQKSAAAANTEVWVKLMGGAPHFPPPPAGLHATTPGPFLSQPAPAANKQPSLKQLHQLLQVASDTISDTTRLHERYLDFSADLVLLGLALLSVVCLY